MLRVETVDSRVVVPYVVREHYLHRKPPISYAFALYDDDVVVGVLTFGTPASRHLQKSACPSDPDKVIELNRLWLNDKLPPNTASWFVSRAMKRLPPRIVVSYADPVYGHAGYVYRAMNFFYAGWTDMERKTPRFDYIPLVEGKHTREASRSGYKAKVRRVPKVKYWAVTGNKTDRRALQRACGWPQYDWHTQPPPL